MTDLSILVMAYNEADNVGPVLTELRAWLTVHEPEAEIVFVDDGSTDETAEHAATHLAGSRHQVVQHPANRGIGAAIKSGVRAATGDWVTFLPADGQIGPEAIGTLRERAEASGSDVVFSVYDDRDDGLDRKVLSFGVRALITLVHGVRLRSDGPYLFRRKLFVPEQLPSDTFFINFEFPIRALQAGLVTSCVTIQCRPRMSGRSKTAKLRVITNVGRELIGLRVRRARQALAQLR